MSPLSHETEMEFRERSYNLKDAGDFQGALKVRQELEILLQASNSPPARQALNLNYTAYLAVCAGAPEEAERAARTCLQIYRPVSAQAMIDHARGGLHLFPCDETLATYLHMLASVLAENKRFDEALAYGEEALAMFSQNHPAGDSFLASAQGSIESMRRKECRQYLGRGRIKGAAGTWVQADKVG